MTKYFAGSLIAAASLFAVSSVSAATLVATTGTPLTYAVHNVTTPDGTLQVLDTSPGGYLVDYTSSDVLHNNGSSGGFAKVSGVGGLGGAGFADLTIDPEAPIIGFTAIKFNIIMPTHSSEQGVPTGTDWSFDTRVYFLGGGFQDFLGTASSPPDRYIVADPTEVMTSIVLSNLKGTSDSTTASFKFDGIEQVSFDAAFRAIPEPSSWAMMIGGFFGLGAMLRRRRSVLAAQTA
jgi:hypothetical protein